MIRLLPFILLAAAFFYFEKGGFNFLEEPGVYQGEGNSGAATVKPEENPVYGAIALSESTYAWGSSIKYTSEDKAKLDATSRCAESGASDCQAQTWGSEVCLALAIAPRIKGKSMGGWGTGRDENIDLAKSEALENCQKHEKDCAIVESFCSRGN